MKDFYFHIIFEISKNEKITDFIHNFQRKIEYPIENYVTGLNFIVKGYCLEIEMSWKNHPEKGVEKFSLIKDFLKENYKPEPKLEYYSEPTF